MTTTGNVQITITDGAAGVVVVPSNQVQVVIGCATAGTVGSVVATRSLSTLSSTFTSGPLVEAAGLTIQAGGTVLAIRATTNAAGYVLGSTQSVPAITGTDTSSPIKITTGSAHGLTSGDVVTIASVVGQTGANGTFVVVVVDATHFTLTGSTSVGAWVSGGTITFTGTVFTGTGTSVPTITGAALDDYYVKILIVAGGTRGTAGITFNLSLDAGRSYGPTIALGTATSYALTGTGLTWNLAAGTLVAGDYITAAGVAPALNAAGVAAALVSLQASPYAVTGWGSIHVVGVLAGADESTIQTTMDTLATGYVFTGCFTSARDAKAPTSYGGIGETDAAWTAAILADFSAVSAKRMLAAAGYYNMPSAFSLAVAGTPRYRRPLAWAQAAREVTIQPQTHSGRVRDGALSQIVVDPVNDPTDGFVYHDERINPGLDYKTGGAGRFTSATTRVGLGSAGLGYYIVNPLMLSPLGSDFWMWPFRAVMDVACDVVHQIGQQFINSDLQTNQNGTLSDLSARTIKTAIEGAIQAQMIALAMISGASVSVDQTQNILITGTVVITVTIIARAYVLEEDVTIGFANQLAA